MTPNEWIGLVGGVVLLAAILAAGWLGLRGGALMHEQHCRVVCPRTGTTTECTIVQDFRTGQWQRVTACSALADPAHVTCSQECRIRANLGYQLPVPLQG